MPIPAQPRPIVVGVDGTACSLAALAFAFEEAANRNAPVVVVTTWMPDFPTTVNGQEFWFSDRDSATRRVQDAAIQTVLAEIDSAPHYTQVVANDVSGPALINAARSAALLVVGTGRKDPLARVFLGSVSEFCVRHSPVPVVVVPAPLTAPQLAPVGACTAASRLLKD